MNKMVVKIPLAKPHFNNEEIEEIKEVLDSGWVSQGPKVNEFERKISKYLNVKYTIAVTNCTCALHLALLSLGIKKGDEVIVADYTYPATGHAVLYCGAKPVFIDVDQLTYNINPTLIEDKITTNTKAIICVHTFGQPAEMDTIIKIAKKHNLKVIEDAACALGAKYKGKFAGTIGEIGCFSLHARKGITTGEGGLVVTNNKIIAEKIRTLSVFGMVPTTWTREKTKELIIPTFEHLGYNYKMSDITAAIGVSQLNKLEKIIKRKIELAKYYNEKLRKIKEIDLPFVCNDVKHIYQSYVVLIKKANRNKIINLLKNKGIQSQIGTYSLHVQPIYKSKNKCPNSLKLFNQSLALPMYYDLKEEDIDSIVFNLKESLKVSGI